MDDLAQNQPMSRRERLRREREERILDAAATVFAGKGFHRATIHEIAQLADVADGTIYNYFADKSALLIGIMTRLVELEQLSGELAQALEGGVPDFFVSAFRLRMGRIVQGQEMLQAILPEVFVNSDLRQRFYQEYVLRLSTLLEQYMQGQIARGRIRPVNVPLTVRMVQSMFVGLIFMRILGDEPLRSGWEDVPETLATLLFDGLTSKDGG